MDNVDQRCGNCRFERDDECHRSPPIRVPRVVEDKLSTSRLQYTIGWEWPAVKMNDWCGEWKEYNA